MNVKNEPASDETRIRLAAEIEVMVARGYGLNATEYSKMTASFNFESKNGVISPDIKLTSELKIFWRAVRDQAVRYMQEERQF